MRQLELTKRVGGMRTGDFVSLFSLPSVPEKYFVNISTSLDNKLSRGIDIWSKYGNELPGWSGKPRGLARGLSD